MNQLLETIADKASADLRSLIESGNDDILTAIHKMQAEAQLQETNPKFSLGFKITVDFDAGTYDCDLSWSLKQTLGVSHKIEDPAQTKLPLDPVQDAATQLLKTVAETGTTMTLKTGDKETTVTHAQANAALKRLSKATGDTSEDEELILACIEVIRSEQKASVSLLQRRLRLGYGLAARIMDELEKRGIVGPSNGAEPRELHLDKVSQN